LADKKKESTKQTFEEDKNINYVFRNTTKEEVDNVLSGQERTGEFWRSEPNEYKNYGDFVIVKKVPNLKEYSRIYSKGSKIENDGFNYVGEKASKEDIDFIYNKKTGEIIYNNNPKLVESLISKEQTATENQVAPLPVEEAAKGQKAEVKEQEVSEIVSPAEIEAGKQEVNAVKKGKIKTTNPIRLFKGLFGKRNLDGTRKSAHPNVKGVFSAVDEKIAERYRGEDGIGTFDIPAGTTIETIRLQNKNVPVSKFREQETEAINASDAQIVKLITLDAKGAEEQYIIKDPALIKMMQKPEDATKAEPKEEVKKEKKTPPQNVLDIAKETGLSPQEVENTYKKYDDTKSIEEITIEDYNSARAAGNEQKLENSKKTFEALLKADSDSPTAKKKAAKIKEEVSKETLKEVSDIMNNIDNIRQQLLDAGVIKSINCKWGK
jgi:hypothetical protein